MTDLAKSFANIRELMGYLSDDDLGDLGDSEFLEYVADFITEQATIISLFEIAHENSITGETFEKWFFLAKEKIETLDESDELNDEDLIGLLKEISN